MGGLQPFGDGLVVVEGPMVRDTGMPFTTRMVVAKLADGSLWVESPVPVSYATLTELVATGPVKYLLAGTPRHYWRLKPWHDLFPEAELWACRTTLATVRHGKLPLAGTLGDHPVAAWADDLDQAIIAGSRLVEEVWYLHRPSRTLIVGDLIQVHPRVRGKPFLNALWRAVGVAGPNGGTARDMRLSFRDRRAARASVDSVLAWDFDRLVMAHGPCVDAGAKSVVAEAFDWVLH